MTLQPSSASQPRYLAALDQGTTSTRFIIFDRQGAALVCAQEEHRQHLPQPGWVEHNPLDILHNTIRVIDGGLEKSGLQASDIACMGITNQRETAVVWDRHTGQPVYNAIVWQDTRVADAVIRLKNEGVEARIRAKTGLPLSTYFSALKVAWILDHVTGARRTRRFALRQYRRLSDVASHRRQAAYHRRDQRQPNSVDGSENV